MKDWIAAVAGISLIAVGILAVFAEAVLNTAGQACGSVVDEIDATFERIARWRDG